MKSAFGFAAWVVRHALVLLVVVSLTGCLEAGQGRRGTADRADNQRAAARAAHELRAGNFRHACAERAGRPGLRLHSASLATPTATSSNSRSTNKPMWAAFSDETGVLTGTPADAHVGDTGDITISVTDGRDTRSIGPFRIHVNGAHPDAAAGESARRRSPACRRARSRSTRPTASRRPRAIPMAAPRCASRFPIGRRGPPSAPRPAA